MKRNDPKKKTVKERLFNYYGEICFVCEKKMNRKYLQLHHIIKFQHSRTTTFEDSSLVCEKCHHNINLQERINKTEYNRINQQIRDYKNREV